VTDSCPTRELRHSANPTRELQHSGHAHASYLFVPLYWKEDNPMYLAPPLLQLAHIGPYPMYLTRADHFSPLQWILL